MTAVIERPVGELFSVELPTVELSPIVELPAFKRPMFDRPLLNRPLLERPARPRAWFADVSLSELPRDMHLFDLPLEHVLTKLENEVLQLAAEYPRAVYMKWDAEFPCSYIYGYGGPGRGCLFGQALRRLGVTDEKMLAPARGIISLLSDAMGILHIHQLPSKLFERMVVLENAQRAQDLGSAWGHAVETLRRMVDAGPLVA